MVGWHKSYRSHHDHYLGKLYFMPWTIRSIVTTTRYYLRWGHRSDRENSEQTWSGVPECCHKVGHQKDGREGKNGNQEKRLLANAVDKTKHEKCCKPMLHLNVTRSKVDVRRICRIKAKIKDGTDFSLTYA